MNDKYDSTDFWYTYLKSLKNRGQLRGSEELEMDTDVQEKLLAYFKTKIEIGVSDGQTALPPNLYDYIPRFPIEMLSELRVLANSVLETNPDNGATVVVLAIVVHQMDIMVYQMDYSEYKSLVKKAMVLAPKDLALILHLLHCYTCTAGGGKERQEIAITALENLFEWEKQQDDTPLYQEVQFCYWDIEITLYDIYKDLMEHSYDDDIAALAARIRALVPQEKAAFPKVVIQKTETSELLLQKTTSDSDFWEVYLDSLENRGLSTDSWELTPQVQAKLVDALKTKIEIGVSEGLTSLPSQLPEYVSRFPESMCFELRLFAEDVLKTQPDNGAAAKMLAIIVKKSESPFLEQAIELLPNDAEICFYAIRRYSESIGNRHDPLFELTLSALEELFERAQRQGKFELYHWLTKLYKEVGRTPSHIYRNLMQNAEGNAELLAKCKPLIVQAQYAFQERLVEEPDDWYALRGLGDIYETLGETELRKKYPWEPHSEFRWEQTAWVGRPLPNFSATTVDGTPLSFSDYRGKLVLLNFCAKWCGFCAPEIPYIKEVYKEHHDKGFDVIGVSLDESEAELREYIEEHDIPWIQIFEGTGWKSELAQYFGINSVPSQWLIDREGKIISVETRQERLGQLVNWTESSRVGNMIPDFSAVDVDGKPVSPKAYRGKVVLLYLGYPEQVLTDIDTLYQKYHKKGFDVIGVSVVGWSNEEALRNRVREKNFLGQHIYDSGGWDGPLAKQFGIDPWRPLPAIVLIDKDGQVIHSRYGQVHSSEAWAAKFEELVATHLGLC